MVDTDQAEEPCEGALVLPDALHDDLPRGIVIFRQLDGHIVGLPRVLRVVFADACVEPSPLVREAQVVPRAVVLEEKALVAESARHQERVKYDCGDFLALDHDSVQGRIIDALGVIRSVHVENRRASLEPGQLVVPHDHVSVPIEFLGVRHADRRGIKSHLVLKHERKHDLIIL